MQNLPKKFEEYLLVEKKVSGKTLRDYRCDLTHFLGWTSLHLRSRGINVDSIENILPHISPSLVGSYKGFHINNKIPQSTTNRRLSTVRNFTNFLIAKGVISHNPAQNITNISKKGDPEQKKKKLIESFKKELMLAGCAPTTIKNYLSDVKHFLAWIERI